LSSIAQAGAGGKQVHGIPGSAQREARAILVRRADSSQAAPQSVDNGSERRIGAWPCAPATHLTAPRRYRGRACPVRQLTDQNDMT
jgi:hypothetical protein